MATTIGNWSYYLAEQILLWAFTDDEVVRPTEWWVGLMSTKAAHGVAGVEFSDEDYARVQVTFNKTGAGTCLADNDAALAFGTPAAAWPDIAGLTIWDAETEGNQLAFFDVLPTVACDAGAPVSVPISMLTEATS